MAGIGFELRRLLRDESLGGTLRAYGLAGLVGSGPWVCSILAVLLVGVLGAAASQAPAEVTRFLVSVSYLMAASLITTGPLQLMFSRFVADRVFEERKEAVVPNLLGALTLTSLVALALGGPVAAFVLEGAAAYRLLMLGCFTTLSVSWILVVLLSGVKEYLSVVAVFAVGNALGAAAALALVSYGLEGLLAGFWAGQGVMLFAMLGLVVRAHGATRLVAYDFARRRYAFLSLGAVGFAYNAGVWADKFVFWMNPATSEPVLGPLRSSVIYDLPIFLAYLSIVPGMAVFLLRVETDFAEEYERFFRAVRSGGRLDEIERIRDSMVATVRSAIFDIFKVQGLTVLALLLSGPQLLRLFGISPLYAPLLAVDLVGVAVQVLLLATLNVLFYLDERRVAFAVTALFAVSNLLLSLLSQVLGPEFFGYGFALAASLAAIVGLVLLSRCLERLEYRTFMLQ